MGGHVKDGVLLQKATKTGSDNETNDDSFQLRLKNDIKTLPCFRPGCVINPCVVFEILRHLDFYKSATLTADHIVHSMQELVSDGVLTCNEKRMRYCDAGNEMRSERWQLYSKVFLEDQLSPKAAGSSGPAISGPVPPCNNRADLDCRTLSEHKTNLKIEDRLKHEILIVPSWKPGDVLIGTDDVRDFLRGKPFYKILKLTSCHIETASEELVNTGLVNRIREREISYGCGSP